MAGTLLGVGSKIKTSVFRAASSPGAFDSLRVFSHLEFTVLVAAHCGAFKGRHTTKMGRKAHFLTYAIAYLHFLNKAPTRKRNQARNIVELLADQLRSTLAKQEVLLPMRRLLSSFTDGKEVLEASETGFDLLRRQLIGTFHVLVDCVIELYLH